MQVLFSLQQNALKFTEKGMVKIITQIIKKEGHYLIEVKVKDSGIGISPNDTPKLFKLFGFSNENVVTNDHGIGMGLVISRMIVKQYKGDLTFQSVENCGSTFTFSMLISSARTGDIIQESQAISYSLDTFDEQIDSLPLVPLPLVSEKEIQSCISSREYSNDISKKNILVVDDQTFNIEALLIMLRYYHHIDTNEQCETAFNGKQALNLVKENIRQNDGKRLSF